MRHFSLANSGKCDSARSGEADRFYEEITSRNHHFVSKATQAKLRRFRILIAGCGSTGGACIESLARLGVEHFVLADNGQYELTNLNRQHAFLEDIGTNKAKFHEERLRALNPYIEVRSHPEGLTSQNIRPMVEWAELVMDAVDVTSASGIEMKLELHERCKELRRPVLTALDIGFCQWGESYDYRDPRLQALGGNLAKARAAKHPMKALFSFVPLSAVPAHALPLLRDLMLDRDAFASQLGGTSDLLSAIIVPSVIRFVERGELVRGWNVNLEYLAMPWSERMRWRLAGIRLRREVQKLLDRAD